LKKRTLLLLLLAAIFIFSVIAPAVIAQPETGVFGALLKPFGGIEKAYDRFGTTIDLVIYLIIFLGLTQWTLGRKFTGKGGKAITVGIAIVFAVSLALFGRTANFNIKSFGPIAALVFVALIGYALWIGMRELNVPCLGKDGSIALVFIVIYFSLAAVVPSLISWLLEHVPIIGALLSLIMLICLVLFMVRFIMCIGGAFGFSWGRGPSPGPGPGPTPPPGPKPPGPVPPPTPRKRKPDDPITPPGIPPPGIEPDKKGPKPKPKPVPKKPPIPPDKEIFVDLSHNFNPIRSQDKRSACTAFAATSIFEYILHTGYGHPKEWLSPMFNWYKARKMQGYGDETTDKGLYYCGTAMKSLIEDGVCYEGRWTFEPSPSSKFMHAPDTPAETDASQKKLIEFKSVDMHDTDQWVHELLNKNPLNIAVYVPDPDWKKPFSQKFYHNPKCTTRGSHAMVVVGYHSHYPYEGVGIPAFKLRNSWDVDWGENGYLWVSAETLKHLVNEDLLVVKGWKGEKIDKFTITGRVVYDEKEMPISPELSGGAIYENHRIRGCEHEIFVGAMVQKAGNLITIADVKVKEKHGRFKLKFKEDLSAIEHFTTLPQKFPKQFKGIDFRKLPKGILVYKRTALDITWPFYYFHVAGFQFTKAGRGGEGMEHPENPCSALVRRGLEVSGVPIVLSEKHLAEKNVIIPICDYGFGEELFDEQTSMTLKKIKKFAEEESEQIAAEFKYLEKLKSDVERDNYKEAVPVAAMVGRSESRAETFENRVETQLKELINEVPEQYQPKLKDVFGKLQILSRDLLRFTSRYTGQIRKDVEHLAKVYSGKTTPGLEIGQIMQWKRALTDEIGGAITTSNGLQTELKKLVNIEEHLLGKQAVERMKF
jgi:hypothetical protein